MVGFVSNQNPKVMKVKVKQATLKPSGYFKGTWTTGTSLSLCPSSSLTGEGNLSQAVCILKALPSQSLTTPAVLGLESSRRSQCVN